MPFGNLYGYNMVCIYVRTFVYWKFRSSGDGNENNGNVDKWKRPADNEQWPNTMFSEKKAGNLPWKKKNLFDTQ